MSDKPHGNSKNSRRKNTLYMIFDLFLKRVFKYGITSDKLDKNGKPKRAKIQTKELNRAVGYDRFKIIVLITNIPGRRIAEIFEKIYVRLYKRKHGKEPPGNR